MYKEYHKCWYKMILAKKNLENTQNKIENILLELSKITVQIKDINVNENTTSDKLTNLIATKIELEKVSKYQKELVDSSQERLNQKLKELQNSVDSNDIIYFLKFVSKYKVKEIKRFVYFSSSYIYELISKMRHELKQIEREVSNDLISKKN